MSWWFTPIILDHFAGLLEESSYVSTPVKDNTKAWMCIMTSTIKVLFYADGRHPALYLQSPELSQRFSTSPYPYLFSLIYAVLHKQSCSVDLFISSPPPSFVTLRTHSLRFLRPLSVSYLYYFNLHHLLWCLPLCNYPLPLDLRSLPRVVDSNVFTYGSPSKSPLPPRCLSWLFVLPTCSRSPLCITP